MLVGDANQEIVPVPLAVNEVDVPEQIDIDDGPENKGGVSEFTVTVMTVGSEVQPATVFVILYVAVVVKEGVTKVAPVPLDGPLQFKVPVPVAVNVVDCPLHIFRF